MTRQVGLEFICANCKKKFFMPFPGASLMAKCTDKTCSPKCAMEFIPKGIDVKVIDARNE